MIPWLRLKSLNIVLVLILLLMLAILWTPYSNMCGAKQPNSRLISRLCWRIETYFANLNGKVLKRYWLSEHDRN